MSPDAFARADGWPRAARRRPAAKRRERATEADRDAVAALAEEARAPGRARARLRALPAAARRERGDRLRGPGVARAAAAARVAGRARAGAARGSSTCSWTSSRTRTGPRRSSSRWSPQRHRNVTVVGDDDQSIYKFRGAAISNILEFRERYRERAASSCCGGTTGRAAPILDAAYRLVRHNDPDRLEVRAGIVKRLDRGAGRATAPRRSATRRSRRAPRRRTGSRRTSRAGSARAPRPRDVAILVRTNAAADPVLRSLNLEGIPWRFSGTSGLYARPEVRLLLSFLRAVADLGSSVDVYALAASDLYGLGGEDLVAIVNTARRRNRSVFDVLDELEPPAGHPAPRARRRARRRRRLVADLRGYVELAHERPAGEVLYAFLRGSGWLKRLAETGLGRRRGGAVQHRPLLRHRPRPVGAARRRPGRVLRPSPPDADPGGRRPADGGHRPRRRRGRRDDRPQGQGPRVPGRVPAGPGHRPVPGHRAGASRWRLPLELVNETLPEGDYQLQEERRLFYVGMTRARDELVLSHAADYGGQRARRVSPFVLEALDLPVAAGASGGGREGAARRSSGSPASSGRSPRRPPPTARATTSR